VPERTDIEDLKPAPRVGEYEMPAVCQYPGALTKPHALVRPVVEQGRADDEAGGSTGVGPPFGGTNGEPQAPVIGVPASNADRGRCGIDARELAGVRALPGHQPQQIPGATTGVSTPSPKG